MFLLEKNFEEFYGNKFTSTTIVTYTHKSIKSFEIRNQSKCHGMNWYKIICVQGHSAGQIDTILQHTWSVQFFFRFFFALTFNSLRIVLWRCKSIENQVTANRTIHAQTRTYTGVHTFIHIIGINGHSRMRNISFSWWTLVRAMKYYDECSEIFRQNPSRWFSKYRLAFFSCYIPRLQFLVPLIFPANYARFFWRLLRETRLNMVSSRALSYTSMCVNVKYGMQI